MAIFSRNRMYRDGAWLGVAVEDTDDPLVPQFIGAPSWGMAEPEFQSFLDQGYVLSSNRFSMSFGGLSQRARWYIPVISPALTYSLFVARIRENQRRIVFASALPSSVLDPGWFELPVELLLRPEQVVEVGIIADNAADTPGVNESWRYGGINQTDVPETGQFNRNQQQNVVRIHTLADNGTNQQAALLNISIGDQLIMSDGNTTWRYRVNAAGVANQQTVVFPDVTLFEEDGTFTIGDLVLVQSFTGALDDTPFSAHPAFWLGQLPPFGFAQGVLETTPGVPFIDDTGYGGDLFVQRADLSADWNIAAFSAEFGE